MNVMLKNAVMGVLGLSAVGAANAAPVNINITGNIIASACTVNNNLSDLNVSLGDDIQAATLEAANSGSTPKGFNLVLSACPVATRNVTVSFAGTGDTTSPTMYKSTGTATSVAVELSQQTTGTILGNGSTLTQAVQTDKTVTYALNARAYSATGSAMPGSVSAVVQANFTYN